MGKKRKKGGNDIILLLLLFSVRLPVFPSLFLPIRNIRNVDRIFIEHTEVNNAFRSISPTAGHGSVTEHAPAPENLSSCLSCWRRAAPTGGRVQRGLLPLLLLQPLGDVYLSRLEPGLLHSCLCSMGWPCSLLHNCAHTGPPGPAKTSFNWTNCMSVVSVNGQVGTWRTSTVTSNTAVNGEGVSSGRARPGAHLLLSRSSRSLSSLLLSRSIFFPNSSPSLPWDLDTQIPSVLVYILSSFLGHKPL